MLPLTTHIQTREVSINFSDLSFSYGFDFDFLKNYLLIYGPVSKKMNGNIKETVAESHKRVWGYRFLVCVNSHNIWFHFAAVSVTSPANGRHSDRYWRPREQKDDREH